MYIKQHALPTIHSSKNKNKRVHVFGFSWFSVSASCWFSVFSSQQIVQPTPTQLQNCERLLQCHICWALSPLARCISSATTTTTWILFGMAGVKWLVYTSNMFKCCHVCWDNACLVLWECLFQFANLQFVNLLYKKVEMMKTWRLSERLQHTHFNSQHLKRKECMLLHYICGYLCMYADQLLDLYV